MKKQTFIQGTLILLAAGIINRMLGFIPRIALPRIIGAEGVGLYQLAYPFFLVLVTVITGGLPLAIAKMVAEAEGVTANLTNRAYYKRRAWNLIYYSCYLQCQMGLQCDINGYTCLSYFCRHDSNDRYCSGIFHLPGLLPRQTEHDPFCIVLCV